MSILANQMGTWGHEKNKMLNVLVRVVLVSFMAVILTVSSASASTLILQPGPDDGMDANWYSYSGYPYNANYGNVNAFEIGNEPYNFQGRSLLKFNIPTEVTGATIQNATLELYAISTYNAPGGIVYVSRATSSWGELNGSIFTPPTYDSLYQTSYVIPNAGKEIWVDSDITNMLNFWVSNPGQNYGMVLTGYSDFSFYPSSDYSDATLRPKLTIEYSSGSPVPEPATILLLPLGLAGFQFFRRRKA